MVGHHDDDVAIAHGVFVVVTKVLPDDPVICLLSFRVGSCIILLVAIVFYMKC